MGISPSDPRPSSLEMPPGREQALKVKTFIDFLVECLVPAWSKMRRGREAPEMIVSSLSRHCGAERRVPLLALSAIRLVDPRHGRNRRNYRPGFENEEAGCNGRG
jgi:hypothetical protein